MPRNGTGTLAAAATSKASAPDEIYDSLGESAQQTWDLIGSLGFRVDKDKDGDWVALAMQGDDIIGPAGSISSLAIAVQNFVEKGAPPKSPDGDKAEGGDQQGGNVVKISQNSKGQQYLEGQEPEIDQELANIAGEYQSYKMDRVNTQNKEKVSKEKLEETVKRKKHLFKTDPDNTNDKIFEITPEFRIRIGKEWTETVTTETGELKKKKGKKAA